MVDSLDYALPVCARLLVVELFYFFGNSVLARIAVTGRHRNGFLAM